MILELQHRRPDGDVDTYHLKPGRRYHLGRGSACEVRILDLKLSRKHAALEFMDGEWQLIDLCSTNGCHLNGTVMVGTSPLREGHVIEIGQTALTIGPISAKTGPSGSSASGPQPSVGQAGQGQGQTGQGPTAKPPAQATAVVDATSYISDEFSSPAHQHHHSGALSPRADPLAPVAQSPVEEAPSLSDTVGTVQPRAVAPPPLRVLPEAPARRSEQRNLAIAPVVIKTSAPADALDLEDTVATVTPAPQRPPPPPFVAPAPKPSSTAPASAPAPVIAPVSASAHVSANTPASASNSEDRSYFITVLGRRVGPLSRVVARDLKSRELKGVLKPSELDSYPQA